MATLKGQNFRICIFDSTAEKYKVIGMATGCTVTLNNNTDDASHKDIVIVRIYCLNATSIKDL